MAEAHSEPLRISLEQLLAGNAEQCAQLLALNHPVPAEERGKQAVTREHLLALLANTNARGSLLPALAGRLEPMETLAAAERGLLSFTDRLFDALIDRARLHPDAAVLLEQLRPAAAANALRGEGWYGRPEHPLRQLTELLLEMLSGWQPDLGRGAQRLLQQIAAPLAELPATGEPEGCAAVLGELQQPWQRDRDRLARAEQRLCAAEQGQLRARRAQQLAARTLNQKIGGKQLTPVLKEFLLGDGYRALQWVLIQEGEQSPLWQRLKKLVEVLVWTVQPTGDDAELEQQRYRLLPKLQEELQELLVTILHDTEQAEQWLQRIESEHLRLLKHQSLDYVSFELIANHDPLVSSSTTISRGLLERVNSLQPGQWFVLQNEEGEQRAKLALKMDEAMQLLFVTQLGAKAGQQSFEEFAYRLSTGAAHPLPGPALLAQVVKDLFNDYISRYRQRRAALSAQSAPAPESDTAQREAARRKAIAEARALAQAQTATESTAARPQPSPARSDDSADISLTQLKVGTWLEFHGGGEGIERLRLAVVLPTSDKYLFVDRNGRKRAELSSTELSERLKAGRALVLDAGPAREDGLTRVVGSLRQQREHPE